MLGVGVKTPPLAYMLGSPSFTPTEVSGCVLWLRADLGITLNGSDVLQWDDQSDSALSFVQATEADQPPYNATDGDLNNQPSVEFGADTTHQLELADATAMGGVDTSTWIFVLKPDSATTNQILLRNAADAIFYYESGAANEYGIYDGTGHRTTGVEPSVVAQYLEWEFDAAGTACQCRVDGSDVGGSLTYDATLDLDKASAINLGSWAHTGTNRFFGSMAELIVYNKILSAAEQTLIGAYMADRYGL